MGQLGLPYLEEHVRHRRLLRCDLARPMVALGSAVLLAGQMLGAQPASAQSEKPQYGGGLDVANVTYTQSPLSWDPADWAWKTHQDALHLERLFAGDLSKSVRNGGKYRFKIDAWTPPDALRGELAQAWQWKETPLRLEIELRRGVMFPAKPGVMAAREVTSDDVVFSFERVAKSPKKVPEFLDYVAKVEAKDRYSVVFTLNRYQDDWDYRLGWAPIVPKEVADAGASDWRNSNGSGPFQLVNYVPGNSIAFVKNAGYWDKESIAGQDYSLPFVDKLTMHIIKDEATALTALRTGKLDIFEQIRWNALEDLKRQVPQLKWSRQIIGGMYLSMRVDTKPFDDIRVRRALNMAVNKPEIVERYWGGHAELFAWPQSPDFSGYAEPLSAMPESIRELFVYSPDKAKRLLAEAGYPNGFAFKVLVCTCNVDLDLLSLIVGYLDRVGVKAEVQALEYGAYYSLVRSNSGAAGVFRGLGFGNPTLPLRSNFVKGQYWNTAQWDDKAWEAKLAGVYTERDEAKRQATVRELTRELIDKAPVIWLPAPYTYAAWWPWVKNYDGELYVGNFRAGPIYARVWVDQVMKKRMGY